MEDNNNNAKKAGDKIKKAGKDAAKKAGIEIAKKILPTILPYIGIFILILLAAGVINLIPYLVRNVFSSLLGLGTTQEATQENVTVLDEAQSIVEINEYGGYDIKVENLSEQILDELENNKVNNEAADFVIDGVEEDMINKYIKAEVQTLYPKTGKKGDLDGLITIQRASAETEKTETLDYITYSEFCNKVDAGDTSVLKNFSLNPDTFDLCIATSDTTKYFDFDGNEITSKRITTITKRELEYQTSVQGYAMPFNFFLSLHMIAQDEEFMKELVDSVLEKEAPITLTYVESTSIDITQNDYWGKQIIKAEYSEIDPMNGQEEIVNSKVELDRELDNSSVTEFYTPEYYKKKKVTNSGTLQVTKADTWLISVEKAVGEVSSNETTEQGDSTNIIKEENGVVLESILDKDSEGNVIGVTIRKQDLEIRERITNTSGYKMHTMVDEKKEIKVDDFINFIKSYPKVKNNLVTAPSQLFYLLQQSETTQQHEKIMRYVIYQLSGVDYGVTEFPLYDISSFGSISSMYGSTVEEKVWWALIDAGFSKEATAGAMGNIYAESTFDPDYHEVGGGGYGLCQWTGGRRTQLEAYAKSKGVDSSNVTAQIEFLITEITPGAAGPAQGYASYQLLSNKGYNGDMWENAESVEEAAIAFCMSFERPSVLRMNVRTEKAIEYYNQFKDMEKPSFSEETVCSAGYEFPHYKQNDYPGPYGTSTIPSSGCGPTSLAMILAGLKGDPSINPYTVVENINEYWPSGSYYVAGSGSSHCIFGSDFLQKYYGVTSEVSYPSESKAMQALENGYALIGREEGHILAIIPAPDEYKKQGYKFYILDSARGHDGPYKSVADANNVVKGSLSFIAIIKP